MIIIREKIWSIAQSRPAIQKELVQKLRIPDILAQILINRGIMDPDEAKVFLQGGLGELHDPYLFRGMEQAVARILRARSNGERILVYGDYDVDGVTSTVVLLNVLRELGVEASYYIPDRLEEGYGLNGLALERAKEDGYAVIITVDCGITAVNEAELAQSLGLDLIITDHHEPQGEIPKAIAVIDAKIPGTDYPWPELAGVGVAFKMGQALLSRELGHQVWGDIGGHLLDIVALGTIADIVALKGENRLLVKYGLELMRNSERPGVKALIQVCGLEDKDINAGHIGFMLAPRINASGRLGSAAMAVELLLSSDYEQALQIATFLDQENKERQEVESKIFEQVLDMIERDYDLEENPVIVLGGEGWHHGVVGIVASKVVEKYYRPTVLIALEGDEGKGSCRSISGFSIFEALQSCKGVLTKFGGHQQAAGVTLPKENLEALRIALNDYARANLTLMDLTPKIEADGLVALHQLNEELLQQIETLEPFGFKNPSPLLLCRSAKVQETKTVGKKGDHLKLKIKGQGVALDGIGFNLGSYADGLREISEVDVAFGLERNYWRGKTTLQLKVKDLKSSLQLDNPLALNPHYYRLKYGIKVLSNKVQIIDSRGSEKQDYLDSLSQEQGRKALWSFNSKEYTPEFQSYSFCEDHTEGINLSGVEDVILYHPGHCFDDFYRIIGYANNSAGPVRIHLLYGEEDLEDDSCLLEARYPERDVLGKLYIYIKDLTGELKNSAVLDMEAAVKFLQEHGYTYAQKMTVVQGLKVFSQLGLIEQSGSGENTMVKLNNTNGNKVDLEDAQLFREGMMSKRVYQAYREYIWKTEAKDFIK